LTASEQAFIFNHMVNRHDKYETGGLDGVYGALSAEIRRRILERLRERPMVVAELAAEFEVSWPAISRHLRVLEEEGLVERHKDGRLHRIQLTSGALAEASRWLSGFESPAVPAAPLVQPAPAVRPELAEALHAELAPAVLVLQEALGGAAAGPGPARYLAGVLRRRLATDPTLRALVAPGCRAFQDLGTWLSAVNPDPAELSEQTYVLAQLAYALRTDPRLVDLALAS